MANKKQTLVSPYVRPLAEAQSVSLYTLLVYDRVRFEELYQNRFNLPSEVLVFDWDV